MFPLHFRFVLVVVNVAIMVSAKQKNGTDLLIQRLTRICINQGRVPPSGGPVSVEIGVFVNYFYTLSEQTQDYSLSMYLRQRWRDERLQFNRLENNNKTLLKLPDEFWQNMWVPDVFFRNEKRAIFHSVTRYNRFLTVNAAGWVWYVTKVTAYLMCPMKLHYYPLDTQICPMRFESFDYDHEALQLKWLEPNDQAVQFDDAVWELPHMEVEKDDVRRINCTYYDTSAQPNVFRSCLEVQFVVDRDITYYLWQFYVPSAMLVILSWASFWISVDAVVARVNIGLMLVLALTNQSIEARSQLPRVSYIKAIDVWTSTCLVFAFSSLIEFALVNIRSRRDAQRARTKISVAPGATAVSQASLPPPPPPSSAAPQIPPPPMSTASALKTVTSLMVPDGGSPPGDSAASSNSGLKPMGLTVGGPGTRGGLGGSMLALPGPVRQLSFNLHRRLAAVQKQRAHHIDRIARCLFPLSFLAFNIVYWLSYRLVSRAAKAQMS